MLETVHSLVMFMFVSLCMSSFMCSSVSFHVCLSVACVSLLLESVNGIDTLSKVLIWGLKCKQFGRVSL